MPKSFLPKFTVIRVYFNMIIFFIMFELVFSCFGACCHSIAMHHTNTCVVPYMQHRMQLQVQHVLDHASCNMQLADLHSHTILNARMHCVNFVNFASVLFVPLLFALYCVAHAAFALLIDKAGVLCNCKFCSCNQANVFADAKCNYSPGNPT